MVVISGVISPLMQAIAIVILLIALLITTHEPPSKTPSIQTVPALGSKVYNWDLLWAIWSLRVSLGTQARHRAFFNRAL